MIAASTALSNYERICCCSLSVPHLGMVGLRAGRWMGTGRFFVQVFSAHIKPYSHLDTTLIDAADVCGLGLFSMQSCQLGPVPVSRSDACRTAGCSNTQLNFPKTFAMSGNLRSPHGEEDRKLLTVEPEHRMRSCFPFLHHAKGLRNHWIRIPAILLTPPPSWMIRLHAFLQQAATLRRQLFYR